MLAVAADAVVAMTDASGPGNGTELSCVREARRGRQGRAWTETSDRRVEYGAHLHVCFLQGPANAYSSVGRRIGLSTPRYA